VDQWAGQAYQNFVYPGTTAADYLFTAPGAGLFDYLTAAE